MTEEPKIDRDHKLLQESLELVAPQADELVASFYGKLFTEHPEVRGLFAEDLTPQRERLLNAIIALVRNFDRPQELEPVLAAMGRAHVRYGASLGSYAVVGSILLDTLAQYAGAAWTPAHAAAWERAYTFAAGTMMAAGAIADPAASRSGGAAG